MIRKLILASIMVTASVSSFAGSETWDFRTITGINSTATGYEHTLNNVNGVSVKISAWSSTGSGCGTVTGNGSTTDTDSCIQSAQLKSWSSGLGVANRDEIGKGSPDHAIDNIADDTHEDLDADMVLLTFEHAVKITGFGVGWYSGDFDASVLAYTDTTAFAGFDKVDGTSNGNWASLVGIGKGWSLIDEQSRHSPDNVSKDFDVDDKNVYSKYWLVGAYNAAFSSEHWTDNNDAFKLSGLQVMKKDVTENNTVSAPTTAAILFSMIALMVYRRKN